MTGLILSSPCPCDRFYMIFSLSLLQVSSFFLLVLMTDFILSSPCPYDRFPQSFSLSLWQGSCGVGACRSCCACFQLSDASSPGVEQSWRTQDGEGRQGCNQQSTRPTSRWNLAMLRAPQTAGASWRVLRAPVCLLFPTVLTVVLFCFFVVVLFL